MSIFDKKYRFEYEGRKLEIIVKFGARKDVRRIDGYFSDGKFNEANDTISFLKWIWKNSKRAKFHSIIRFILVYDLRGQSNLIAMVDQEEAMLGNIYINISQFLTLLNRIKNPIEFAQFFLGAIEHEIAHLYAYQKNFYLNVLKKASKKIKKIGKVKIKFSEGPALLSSLSVSIRERLGLLIKNLQLEGVAEWCRYEYEQKYLSYTSNEVLIDSYNKCEPFFETLQNLEKIYELYFSNQKKFYKVLAYLIDVSNSYVVGFHMAYSIMYYYYIQNQQNTIEEIMEISPLKFIREYEKAISSLGLRPVISLNSGNGYFDYNRALNNLFRYHKQLSS